MRKRLTNYEGDAEALCTFCNRPQRVHFVNVGEIDGETYLHHRPCEEQISALLTNDRSRPGLVERMLRRFFAAKRRTPPVESA